MSDGYNVVERLTFEGFEKVRTCDVVLAVCGDKVYVVKDRWSTEGVSHMTPQRPDMVIGYKRSSEGHRPVFAEKLPMQNPRPEEREPGVGPHGTFSPDLYFEGRRKKR